MMRDMFFILVHGILEYVDNTRGILFQSPDCECEYDLGERRCLACNRKRSRKEAREEMQAHRDKLEAEKRLRENAIMELLGVPTGRDRRRVDDIFAMIYGAHVPGRQDHYHRR